MGDSLRVDAARLRRYLSADKTAASECGVKFSAFHDRRTCSRGTRGCIGEHDTAGLAASPLPLAAPDVAIAELPTTWRAPEPTASLRSAPVVAAGDATWRAMRRGDSDEAWVDALYRDIGGG